MNSIERLEFEENHEYTGVIEALKSLGNPKPSQNKIKTLTEVILKIDQLSDNRVPKQFERPKLLRLIYIASVAAVAVLVLWGFLHSGPREENELPLLPPLIIEDQSGGPGDIKKGAGININCQWPAVPAKLTVYKTEPYKVDDRYIDELMNKFGIKAKKRDKVGGFEDIIGQHGDSLSISENGMFIYRLSNADDNRGVNLPSDDEAKILALDYLRNLKLIPKDEFDISVNISSSVGTYDTKLKKEVTTVTSKTVVLRRRLSGYEDLNSMISVEIGDNKRVGQVAVYWPKVKPVAEYPIISAQQALEKIKKGDTVYDNPFAGDVKRIYIGYLANPSDLNNELQYIQPVYVFEGEENRAVTAAVKDKYISGKKRLTESVPEIEDRTHTQKEFSIIEPVGIEKIENGQTTGIYHKGDVNYARMTETIRKLLEDTPQSDHGGGMAALQGGGWEKDESWWKPREIIKTSNGLHVVFDDKVKISTSLAPDAYAQTDRYGNFIVCSDHLFLLESREKYYELIYDDGKTMFIKSLGPYVGDIH